MENHPRSEDPYHSPRYTHNSTKGESPCEPATYNQLLIAGIGSNAFFFFTNTVSVLSNGVSESKPPGKKNTGKQIFGQ